MFEKNKDKAAQILNTTTSFERDLGVTSPIFLQIRSAASNENLSHDVPYIIAKELAEYNLSINPMTAEPPSISVFDDDGNIREYKISKLNTNNDGIVGFILTDENPDNPRIHLVFRGTKDFASAYCNLDKEAAGSTSFEQSEEKILEHLHFALQKLSHKPAHHLYISGHSLGGAFAQYATKAVMVKMNQFFTKKTAFSTIQRIVLNHANSAGVSYKTYADCKTAAEDLAKTLNPPKIIVNVIRVAGDPVQQTGVNILYDATNDVAEINLMKIINGAQGWFTTRASAIITATLAAGTLLTPQMAIIGNVTSFLYFLKGTRAALAAHKAHNFKDQDQIQYELYDNSTEIGRSAIVAKLTRFSAILDNGFTEVAKATAQGLCGMVSRTTSPSTTSDVTYNSQAHSDIELGSGVSVCPNSLKITLPEGTDLDPKLRARILENHLRENLLKNFINSHINSIKNRKFKENLCDTSERIEAARKTALETKLQQAAYIGGATLLCLAGCWGIYKASRRPIDQAIKFVTERNNFRI